MSQSIPEHQSQAQDNLIKDTNVSGDLTFAPVQIGTKIETLIVESSLGKVTQRELNKRSPYQGLKRFNLKDRDRFFGRDKLIARLFEAVNRSSLSLVLGASGSGKSSVVRAGLIPELKKSLESQIFYDFILTPSLDPFDSLYRCLLSEEKDYSFSKAEARIALEAKADTLTKLTSTLKKKEERWLIFIDQFEELFTICEDADKRKNFISGLVEVARLGDSSIKIVLAMRSDFLEQFSFYLALGAIANQNNIHLVTEMYPDDLRQAIEQPAAKHGVVFEEGLVEQIIKEVEGQKGYLPLLQYTLNLLWESECQTIGVNGRPEIEDRTLTKRKYAALEGVRGALQKRVKDIYSTLDQDQQTTTKQVFLKLVNIVDTDAGSRAVSRRAYREEFVGESMENILSRFTEANLLVTSSELSQAELQGSENKHRKASATVEIAHETLLSSWDKLKEWLEQGKEAIVLKNWLAGETRRWQEVRAEEESKAEEELLKGSRLAQVVELRNKGAFAGIGGLRPEKDRFIDASVEKHDRLEQEKATRRKREIRTAWGIAVGSLVAVIISGGLGLMAWNQKNQAEINSAEFLGQSSLLLFREGKELEAFIQAIKAGKILQSKQRTTNPEVLTALQAVRLQGRERNRLEGTGQVWSVSFSPDGKIFASGGNDDTIRLWNVETGMEIRTLSGHTNAVEIVSFSPDGKTLASGSLDKTIKLWNVETGREIRTLPGGNGSVSFSPDGKTLASTSDDKTIKLWNVETGKEISTLSGHTDSVWSVKFSPDGKTLATGSKDQTIKLWSVETGQELRTLSGHTDKVYSISFSPDGKTLASGSDDKTILWNVETGQELRTLPGGNGSVSFSPDGKTLASNSNDNTIKLWNVETGKEIRTLSGHTYRVTSVSFSPDGKTLASGSFGTIKLWNVETGQEIFTLSGHTAFVNSISFSPDGKTLASNSNDNTIKLWNVETGKEIHTFSGHTDNVWRVSFSPDGKTLASGSHDKTIKLWNLETSKEIHTLSGHTDKVYSISFSPDGKTLASGSDDKTIKLWNLETGQEIRTLSGHTREIRSVSFSPDGKTLATGSRDATIKLWNVETGQEIITLSGHTYGVWSVSFSPDGKTLASSSLINVKLWNVETGKEIRTLPPSNTYSLSFSPDGKTLASSNTINYTIELWNVETGQGIRTLSGHTGAVYSVSFSPDGKTLASGSWDKTIKLWNVETGQGIRTFSGHTDIIYSVSFSPDGKTLASGSWDKTIKLWDVSGLDFDSLMSRNCNWVRNYLQNNPKVSESDKHLCDGIGR